MKDLDELVDGACARILTSDEVKTLCELAQRHNAAQNVVLKLLSARTAAGRTNLAAIRPLTAPHAPKRRKNYSRRVVVPWDEVKHRKGVSSLPFTVTGHAFERYAERHLPEQDLDQALAFLIEEAMSAKPIREKARGGEQQWKGKSGVLFVMRRDGNGMPPVCVTILPREEDMHEGRRVRFGKPLRGA